MNPVILYGNKFEAGKLAATDTATGFSVDNIVDLNPDSKWLAASAGIKHITNIPLVNESLAQEEMRISPADGYAGVYLPADLDLSPYLGDRIVCLDSALKKYIGYLKSIESTRGVNMTYVSSGGGGITIANDDNLNMAINDFTIIIKKSLPDWTQTTILFSKWASNVGVDIGIKNSGVIQFYLNATEYNSTAATSFVDGTENEIAIVVKRETPSTAGSVTHYANRSQLGTVKTIPAGSRATVSNSATFRILARYDGVVRYDGVGCEIYIINRALSASEIANGISEADKWGKQNESSGNVTLANMRLSLADGYAFVDFSAADVLTDYIGRRLTITDSAGKKAIGYIKAPGPGETYGDELVDAWANNDYSTYGFDTFTAGSGSDITQAVSISGIGSAIKTVSWAIGRIYRVVQTINIASGGTPSAYYCLNKSLTSPVGAFVAGSGTGYKTIPSGGANYAAISYNGATDFSLSGFSCKSLNTPASTGVTIVSTPDGSTYNWEYIETGFNYNDSSGYTYTIDKLGATLALEEPGIDDIDSLNSATLINCPGLPYTTFSGASDTGFHAESDGSGPHVAGTTDAIPFVSGRKYRVQFTLTLNSGTAPFYGCAVSLAGAVIGGASASNLAVEGLNTYEFTCTGSDTGVVEFWNNSEAADYDISDFSVVFIGWKDSSTNSLDAAFPASGCAVVLFNNIVSTPGGSTYNWESKETGYNHEDAGGYSLLGDIADDINGLGIMGHNLGTAGASVSVVSSDDGTNWTERLAAFTPSSDNVILKALTSFRAAYRRLTIDTDLVEPYIGEAWLDEFMEMPYTPDTPETPYEEGIESEMTLSRGGKNLGVVTSYFPINLEYRFSNLLRTWVTENYVPFWEYAKYLNAFFFAPDLDIWPDDVFWCIIDPSSKYKAPTSMLLYVDYIDLKMQAWRL